MYCSQHYYLSITKQIPDVVHLNSFTVDLSIKYAHTQCLSMKKCITLMTYAKLGPFHLFINNSLFPSKELFFNQSSICKDFLSGSSLSCSTQPEQPGCSAHIFTPFCSPSNLPHQQQKEISYNFIYLQVKPSFLLTVHYFPLSS